MPDEKDKPTAPLTERILESYERALTELDQFDERMVKELLRLAPAAQR